MVADALLHKPSCLGIESYITGQLATGQVFLGMDHQANGQKSLWQRHHGSLEDGAGQHIETGLASMARTTGLLDPVLLLQILDARWLVGKTLADGDPFHGSPHRANLLWAATLILSSPKPLIPLQITQEPSSSWTRPTLLPVGSEPVLASILGRSRTASRTSRTNHRIHGTIVGLIGVVQCQAADAPVSNQGADLAPVALQDCCCR